nr:hypothetical protein Iba_chr08dCG5820 [Ipomoea batatas]
MIIRIESIRSMPGYSIWFEARVSLQQRRAVHFPGATSPIQCCLKHLFVSVVPSHTVSLICSVVCQHGPGSCQVQDIYGHSTGIKEPPVLFRNSTGPLIFVVQLIDVTVVSVSVIKCSIRLGGVALRRPTRFSHHNGNIREVEISHSEIRRINYRIEHISVVGERVEDNIKRVWSGDFDLGIEISSNKSGMNELHGGYQDRSGVWKGRKDFGSNRYGSNVGGGDMSKNIAGNPVGCSGIRLTNT